MKAVTAIGFEPPNELEALHEIYRKHIVCIFEYQFPEHFGEVLMSMLKVSNGGTDAACVSVSVWMDILNSISKPLQLKLNVSMREQLRQYAHYQRILQNQELLDAVKLISQHFANERLQYGLYGLYPKCRKYVDVYVILMGMIGEY